MKTHRIVPKFLLVALLAATAMAASSFTQSMGDTQHGSFTLPFEAYWGMLDLKPGSYSFDVSTTASGYLVGVQQGDRQVGWVPAAFVTAPIGSLEDSDGALLCVRYEGACAIRALKLPWQAVYYFNVVGGSKALQSQQTETVSVLYAEK
jgi:hypothetical protein